jgi:tetratricopeptide (TPR) repeat protein
VYGVSIQDDRQPAFDEHLQAGQKSEILGDCSQLLLILAETEAQSAPETKSAERDAQLREALRLLDQALRFGAPSKAYHLRRARYLSRLGDESAAAQANDAAERAAVTDVLDHFLMADELYRRGDLEDAIREFEHVLQSKPDHFWAQYLNGLCLLRLNRHAEAKTMLTACLAQGREFVWLYLLRGFAHGELKAWDAAESDFQKALQLPLDDHARYVLFVNRGVLRIKQDRFDDAIADLNEATRLKPAEYQAFVNLAQAHRRLNDLAAALKQLDLAVEREPTLAHLYRLRARLRLERNEPGLALADLDQAIEREDASSSFHVEDLVDRGRLLLRASQHEQSLASFDAALQIQTDHSLAQRLRAEALFHLGRFQDVIAAFDRYLETGKPLESVYRGRGLAKSELGQYPGAIEDFTKALELQPTSAVQAYRGWMHVVVDAPKLAERDFQLAIELDPRNADAFCGRGFVRAISKQPREALADGEEALRLGPKTPRLLYNTARIYAQAARANDSDSKTFELISEALAALPEGQRAAFWNSQVRTDAALDSIRKQPRFLQIEKEMLLKK